MAVAYTGMQPPAWLEEFQRNLLQGGFDLTKTAAPGGIPKQTITPFQGLQTGAISGIAGLYGIDPSTGAQTGTGAAYDPYFTTAQADIGTGINMYINEHKSLTKQQKINHLIDDILRG